MRNAPPRRRPPRGREPRRADLSWILIAAGALLLTAGVILGLVSGWGRPGSAAERPVFDGGAAFALVERQVAFGPRVPNTDAHRAMRAFLTERLRGLADSVAVHEFTHVTVQGDTLRLANVLASFDPRSPSRILLAAHWDTRPVANEDPDSSRRREPIPGANDGGSGVAVLLTLAEVLRNDPLPSGHGVDLLFLDGEDYGHDPVTLSSRAEDMYLGAREFARTHARYRPIAGILLDLVGDRDPMFKQEAYSREYAPEIVERVWRAAADLGHGEIFTDEALGYITDDHLFLNQAGIRTIDIIDFDYPAWHTLADRPDRMSAETLRIVGDVLLEVLYNRL
ncbi:MAG: M28 family peptidase [Gemmatimonadetes bacterium]|nr:M28 family peptidase [Gemmatimonadota bacterium]